MHERYGKIDLKKWRAAHEAAKQFAGNEAELTRLYSIRAAWRGRAHRQAAELTHGEASVALAPGCCPQWEAFRDAGGRLRFELGLEDQRRYLEKPRNHWVQGQGMVPGWRPADFARAEVEVEVESNVGETKLAAAVPLYAVKV